MSLTTIAPAPGALRPDYSSCWQVDVDKAIMRDHDDVWNPLTTNLILKLYYAAVTGDAFWKQTPKPSNATEG